MGKPLFVNLSNEEVETLTYLSRKSNDYRSVRALIILTNTSGDTVPIIARKLRKNHHTVRSVIKNYIHHGLVGLLKKKNTGRKRTKIDSVIDFLKETIERKPSEFGYAHQCWNKKLLMFHYYKQTGEEVSSSTMYRALMDAGYSYKRPRKSVSDSAPTKEKKLESIKNIAGAIKKFAAGDKVNVVFVDESHFSTQPYLTRGWYKIGKRFSPQDT